MPRLAKHSNMTIKDEKYLPNNTSSLYAGYQSTQDTDPKSKTNETIDAMSPIKSRTQNSSTMANISLTTTSKLKTVGKRNTKQSSNNLDLGDPGRDMYERKRAEVLQSLKNVAFDVNN